MNKIYDDNTPWNLIAKSFSGELELFEEEDLQEWLAKDTQNQKKYSELKSIWDTEPEDKFLTATDTEAAWLKLQRRLALKKESSKTYLLRFILPLSAAAAIFIIGLLGWWIIPNINTSSENDNLKFLSFVNESNEPKSIQMPDGSTIFLNRNSELKYPEKFDKRIVVLKGEAHFNVTYNPKNPFLINVDDTKIEVLGTSFNVKNDEKSDEISVMVESGKVLFTVPDKDALLLLSGKGALYSKSLAKIELKNNPNASSWKTKFFKFSNTPVKDVIKSLESVYGLKIQLSKESMLACEFNGVFDNIAPENILHALSFSIGAEMSFSEGIYHIKGEGCNN